MSFNSLYYHLKPFIPRRFQIALRRLDANRKRDRCANIWPIDPKAATPPPGWSGWPEGKEFALILTHDVDTGRGQDKCNELMELEKALGFRSSFNFVPERYNVKSELRKYLMDNGFEVGVHGLYHDGKYYTSREIFRNRALEINKYLKEWGSVGFRSPSMLHNLEWIHDLDIEYDASTFDTDPFEPQPDGVNTIFPFWVKGNSLEKGYVELPYTLPQDFTLFVLMKEEDINIWKEKLDWIVAQGGMALLITHPDYMNFTGRKCCVEEYPVKYYQEFLEYLRENYCSEYWHACPKDVARFVIRNLGYGEKRG